MLFQIAVFLFISLLNSKAVFAEHTLPAQTAARMEAEEIEQLNEMKARFCKDTTQAGGFGVSVVFYNNRDDFRRVSDLHSELFRRMGLLKTQTESIPVDAPLFVDSKEKKSVASHLRAVSEKALAEISAGRPGIVNLAVASHGNERVLGRQNERHGMGSSQTIEKARSELSSAQAELESAKAAGDAEKISAANEKVKARAETLRFLMGGADLDHQLVNESNIPWQNFLDLIYENIDPRVPINLFVDACHSGSVLKQLSQNPTNRYWRDRDFLVIASNKPHWIGLGNVFIEGLLDNLPKTGVDRCALLEAIGKTHYRALVPPTLESTDEREYMLKMMLSAFQPVSDHPHAWHSSVTKAATEPSNLSQEITKIYSQDGLRYIPASPWLSELGTALATQPRDSELRNLDLEMFSHRVGESGLGSWANVTKGYFKSAATLTPKTIPTLAERSSTLRNQLRALPSISRGVNANKQMAGMAEWEILAQDPREPFAPGNIFIRTLKDLEITLDQVEQKAEGQNYLGSVLYQHKMALSYFRDLQSGWRGYFRTGELGNEDSRFSLHKLLSADQRQQAIKSIEDSQNRISKLLASGQFKSKPAGDDPLSGITGFTRFTENGQFLNGLRSPLQDFKANIESAGK